MVGKQLCVKISLIYADLKLLNTLWAKTLAQAKVRPRALNSNIICALCQVMPSIWNWTTTVLIDHISSGMSPTPRVRSHAPSIQSHRGIKVVWPDFQPMRVPEEPVCIDLFRQNPVFTSLHLKSPVHVHRLRNRITWSKFLTKLTNFEKSVFQFFGKIRYVIHSMECRVFDQCRAFDRLACVDAHLWIFERCPY